MKLATFYRLVGGDYDGFFLDTTSRRLSFLYQSLGCYHTLQPEKDPFSPPTVPTLTPQGFVRWQTIQLLLEPEEHVPFLQEAVKRFEITNPSDGSSFPKLLPKEALPTQPDMEMVEWHESVSDRLRLEAQASRVPNLPVALSDCEAESSIASSIDEQSIISAAGYSSNQNPCSSVRLPNFHISPWAAPTHKQRYHPPQDAPWSPERQRNNIPANDFSKKPYKWSHESATPTGDGTGSDYILRHRPRRPSSVSTASSSSCSSSPSTSSASLSPALHPKEIRRLPHLERRHSTSFPYDPRNPTSRPSHHHQNPPRPQTSYFPSQHPLYPPPPGPPPPRPPRANAKGLNVRWRDVDSVFHFPGSESGTPDENPTYRSVESYSFRERARSDANRNGRQTDNRRMMSPLRGVGGRRYATEGMSWR